MSRNIKKAGKHSGAKRLLFSILAFLFVLTFAACGNAQTTAPPSAGVSQTIPPVSPSPVPTPVKTTQPETSPSTVVSPADAPEHSPTENAGSLPLSGVTIGLDPGHQSHANSDREPVSPGSSETKAKVSSGTQGRFTRVPEYKINLQVGLKLKEKLEALGATVIMTREKNDVDISNAERAQMMNEAGVDCWLRIHANGNDDSSVYGMFMLVPKKGCLDTSDENVYNASVSLGEALLKAAVASTGAKDLGLQPRGDQSGFNWSQVPVCNIEMGYMTNENEDNLLVSDDYQEKIAEGLAQGFVDYFTN